MEYIISAEKLCRLVVLPSRQLQLLLLGLLYSRRGVFDERFVYKNGIFLMRHSQIRFNLWHLCRKGLLYDYGDGRYLVNVSFGEAEYSKLMLKMVSDFKLNRRKFVKNGKDKRGKGSVKESGKRVRVRKC